MTSYGSCTYAYKPDGSLQSKTWPDGTTLYDYDAFGNLRYVYRDQLQPAVWLNGDG